MGSAAAVVVAVALWLGCTLLLAQVRSLSRPALVDRLAPHEPGGMTGRSAGGVLSARSFRAALGPIAGHVGERIAGWLGVAEPLADRLRRVDATVDAASFRLRQFAWTGGALCAGAAASATFAWPPPIALAVTGGAGALAFLLIEQQLAAASTRRQQRILLELPVVSEQVGMLMGAGYSLGGALSRVAERGTGTCAEDLRVVGSRIRQGLTEVEALREWAEVADVDALTRLVAILALNRETSDLGRLVADEARAIRREVHRTLVEQIERRSQQVWIPVTVATLVPGAVLLAVPFLEALRLFSST